MHPRGSENREKTCFYQNPRKGKHCYVFGDLVQGSRIYWRTWTKAMAMFEDKMNKSHRLYVGETTCARVNETKKTRMLDCNLVDFGRKSRFFNQSQ